MTRSTWIALVLAVACAPAAGADSFLDRAYGTPESGLSPRSRALGGAGVALATGCYSLVDNPAMLATLRGSQLQLSGALARLSENRFVPLFDTFDSFVDEAAIGINDHTYLAAEGGAVWDPGWPSGAILAAGWFGRYDPRYDYADERRSNETDAITAERIIRTRGRLETLSFGAGLPIRWGLSAGAAVNLYHGSYFDRDALVSHASTVTGSVSARDRRMSGWSGTAGLACHINERLDLGAAVETRVYLHDDYTEWLDGTETSPLHSSNDLILPYRLQGGLAYRPRNTFRTTFAADVIYMPWTSIADDLAPGLELHETWDVRFGLEHVYYNSLPGRIGFRYARSYATHEADRAFFTFGLGFRAERVRFDLAGELGKRISRQEPLLPREEQPAAVGAGRDRVEDTSMRLTAGAQFGF